MLHSWYGHFHPILILSVKMIELLQQHTALLLPIVVKRSILNIAEFLQSWTKPNVTPKNLLFIFPLPLFPPIQCCRLVVVGALVENSASRCLSHLLINTEWGDRVACRSVTLVLSTIVWKLKKAKKNYSWKVLNKNLFLRLR